MSDRERKQPADDERARTRYSRRTRALHTLLIERRVVQPALGDAVAARYERDIGPWNGAKVVVRAWLDADFRARLIENPWPAIMELQLPLGGEWTPLRIVENTPTEHHVIVCTLCSCYPTALIGLPPTWYKSPAYRSRMVREPRRVLAEMGLALPEQVRISVWDSSAEVRYMVMPERPAGTEGWSPERLLSIITRDVLIGVGRPRVRGPHEDAAGR